MWVRVIFCEWVGFDRESENKRNMQQTCENATEIEMELDDFERKLFQVQEYSDCNILDIHLGVSGDIYISGLGSASSNSFILRLDPSSGVNPLVPKWQRTNGVHKWYTTVDPLERALYSVYQLETTIDLREINATDGTSIRRYTYTQSLPTVDFLGMTWAPNTDGPLYLTSNSNYADFWEKGIDSANTPLFESATTGKALGKIAYYSSTSILMHHQIGNNLYLSSINPVSTSGNWDYLEVYACPNSPCSSNFENSHILVNSNSASDAFACMEYSDQTTKYFIFVTVNMSTKTIGSNRYITTNNTIEIVNSLRVYDGNLYFLISKRNSSTGQIRNVLLIHNATSSNPFASLHTCLSSKDVETVCQGEYFTTDSSQVYLAQMVINSAGNFIFMGKHSSNKCVRITASLKNLANTLDWENEATPNTYFSNFPNLGTSPTINYNPGSESTINLVETWVVENGGAYDSGVFNGTIPETHLFKIIPSKTITISKGETTILQSLMCEEQEIQ
ncbi:unnamed protein product [Moneuplotes crassus]|uniref:Uncharacterized protein n=1 Tax=Euplotes crassus TaxID=5936 RepID=A0AAD1XJI8_EUPCR|nr:unnamed protein product [Moneuplotes crassus]